MEKFISMGNKTDTFNMEYSVRSTKVYSNSSGSQVQEIR